jgi:UDP-N-acetyl-D-mannosaminuronate dehydrogenase
MHKPWHIEKIGFIGLGKLGMPCAEATADKGFDVAGYDILEKKSDKITKNL